MTISTILYITLALLIALGFSFFQYLYQKNQKSTREYVFFGLRALSVWIVLLLFINPEITTTSYELEKPSLVLLSDNSQSISHLNADDALVKFSGILAKNEKINANFEISKIHFGDEMNISHSLDFTASQSDIYSALSKVEELFPGKQTVLILLTDGNQSMGRDYQYFSHGENTSLFPVILGDTATYKDLSIERINSNRYAFLKNRFPVEAFLNYTGKEEVKTNVRIKSGEAVLFSQEVEFSKSKSSQRIRTNLLAGSLGVKTYTLEIETLEGEKNTGNNKQNFAVEVIDERTNVLILSGISHPDLGALEKSIESNQQRSADIKYVNDNNIKIKDYQLVILYQVNRSFNKYISEILENNLNYLMISGSKTDWNYLNNLDLGYSRNSVNQPQEFFPVYNSNFTNFQFQDIGFSGFPPLIDKFGPLDFEKNNFNILLYQKIQGVNTEEPLLGVSQTLPKSGFLFGENIWRWRAQSYLNTKSFEEFDNFFGKLIQNLASRNSRQRLTIDAENFYYSNQDVIISAQYFDENYQFDPGANLKINIKNDQNGNTFSSDLILKNNFYQFDGGDLEPGNYSFSINYGAKNISKTGTFEVVAYNSEQQFVSSNLAGMKSLAKNNESNLYYQDEANKLIDQLLKEDKFRPVQKSREKNVPLIDWYYLLFILIIVLAAEWFYRKYLGLI